MIFPATSTSIYGWDFPWRTVSHNQMVNDQHVQKGWCLVLKPSPSIRQAINLFPSFYVENNPSFSHQCLEISRKYEQIPFPLDWFREHKLQGNHPFFLMGNQWFPSVFSPKSSQWPLKIWENDGTYPNDHWFYGILWENDGKCLFPRAGGARDFASPAHFGGGPGCCHEELRATRGSQGWISRDRCGDGLGWDKNPGTWYHMGIKTIQNL